MEYVCAALRTVLHVLEGSYLEVLVQGMRAANPHHWQALEAVRKILNILCARVCVHELST